MSKRCIRSIYPVYGNYFVYVLFRKKQKNNQWIYRKKQSVTSGRRAGPSPLLMGRSFCFDFVVVDTYAILLRDTDDV